MREVQAWSCHHLHQGRKSGQRKRRKIGSEDAKSATKGREGGAGDTWTPGEMALPSLLKGLHQLPVIPQPTATPLPPPAPGGGARQDADLFLGTGTSCALFSGDREGRQVQTYYLPPPRSSSSVLFQRVCLAWD